MRHSLGCPKTRYVGQGDLKLTKNFLLCLLGAGLKGVQTTAAWKSRFLTMHSRKKKKEVGFELRLISRGLEQVT